MKRKIYDISPVVSERLGVFPGDVPFQRKISLDFKAGHHLLLSSVQTTLHIGAHADGPNHYVKDGIGIGERSLLPYIGRVQVIELKTAGGTKTIRNQRVQIEDLANPEPLAPRVLFKTTSFPQPEKWNSDFASLSPDLIEHMGKKGVRLLGIDTPSIDPEEAKDLLSHHAIARWDMAILEGLILDEVPEGIYTLIALPLRLENADASPVRAILLTDPHLNEIIDEALEGAL